MFNAKILKKNIYWQLILLFSEQKNFLIPAKKAINRNLTFQKKSPKAGDEICSLFVFMQPSSLFFVLFGLLQFQVQYQNFLQMILRNALQRNRAWARAL